MKVMVTGGAGFIGANLVRRLAGEPAVDGIVVVDDLSTGEAGRLDAVTGVDLVKASVVDADAVHAAASGCDAIVHLAALASVPESLDRPVDYHEVNVTGTLRALEAARRHGSHVIVASSAAVYGQDPPLPATESLVPDLHSVYASSKLAAEAHALAYRNAFDLPVLVPRFFNVFGPLQDVGHVYAAVIPAFVSAAVRDAPVTIFGDGEQTRDMVPVGAVTAVLTDAVLRRVSHPTPVNLASGSRRSLLDIVGQLEEILGTSIARDHQPPRAGDVRHSQADTSTLHRLFPAVDTPDFTDELRATVAWFRERGSRHRHPGTDRHAHAPVAADTDTPAQTGTRGRGTVRRPRTSYAGRTPDPEASDEAHCSGDPDPDGGAGRLLREGREHRRSGGGGRGAGRRRRRG